MNRSLALAALVDRHRGVVDHLQERHHALALAVGALDVAAERPHRRPVVAQAAGVLGQQRVVLDRLVDAVEVVGNGGQVTGRQLRVAGAAVEQGRRRAHEVEARQHLVELGRPRLAVDLVDRQPHRHPHEEGLRQFEAAPFVVQEVAVVQRLQTEVVELQVALGLERRGQPRQVELRQPLVEKLGLDTVADEAGKVLRVTARHRFLRHVLAEHLPADRVQQKPGSDVRIGRIPLDQRPRREDRRLDHFLERHAVVEVLQGIDDDRFGRHVLGQADAGRVHQRADQRRVQRYPSAVVDHRQPGLGARLLLLAPRPLLGPLLAIEHVGPGHVVGAVAHQGQFDLVLDVLDVERAAGRLPSQQGLDHAGGQLLDLLAHCAGGRGLAATHRKEGLGHGHRDLGRLEADHRAVASDQLVVGERGRDDPVHAVIPDRPGSRRGERHGRRECTGLL